MNLADAVKAHLLLEGFPIGVGVRPDDATDTRPYAVVSIASTTFPDDGNDVDLQDEAATSLVQIKTYGQHLAPVSGLAGRLDRRIRDGQLTVPGHAVTNVTRDVQVGPGRDDDTHPSPALFDWTALFRIDTAPDLTV